jgi:hypothetical protein
MSSTSNGFHRRPTLSLVDASPAGRHPDVVLACAAAVMVRAGEEIDHLWGRSMTGTDRVMTERLAEASHALRRAARLLEPDAIG